MTEAELSGRTALVTGGAQGLGKKFAEHLAAAAALVADAHRGPDADAPGTTPGTTPVTVTEAVDLTDPVATRAACARLEEVLGGVGLLVNNAGVLEQREVPFADDDLDDVWRVVDGTLRPPMNVTHALLPGMLARGGGRVVAINSGFGHRSGPAYTGYQVGKGALARFTASLDAQYRDQGLRAFDLAPGVVPTDMSTSMPMHADRTEWTPVEAVVDLLLGIADGRLDRLAGRFLRAGSDTVSALEAHTEEILRADARRLRLVGWGDDDPLTA